MSLDPALELFARRLTSSDEDRELNETPHEIFREALKRVCYRFNAELPLPFKDCAPEAYSEQLFVQLDASTELRLGNRLIEHVSAIAGEFIKGVSEKNIDVLYRLEIPQGVHGALSAAPFRLVWDYWMVEDCYVARFDLLGHVQASNLCERIE